MRFCELNQIPVDQEEARQQASLFHGCNLLHISYEGGELEDPWVAPQEDMWRMTTCPAKAPDVPEVLTIRFEKGDPVAINDEALRPRCTSHAAERARRRPWGGPARYG